jgi:hypothetical protein
MKKPVIPRTSLNRYSGISRGFEAFFYAIVTENVAEIDWRENSKENPALERRRNQIAQKNCI